MPSTSTPPQISAPPSRNWQKPVLWAIMGAAVISVTLYSEIPLLRSAPEKRLFHRIPWMLIPHIAGGLTALLSGPLQFSSRLRRRNPKFHRILGRVYVSSVFIAAPLAILMAVAEHTPRAALFVTSIVVQAGTWFLVTAAAFLTARNRHIQQHREWMVRSYALTFTFVGTRILQPIPAWNRLNVAGLAIATILITFLAVLIPDIALNWRQLTTRRV
jgi:uncharacterized membrane protein